MELRTKTLDSENSQKWLTIVEALKWEQTYTKKWLTYF